MDTAKGMELCVIYDFCQTICDFETADAFVEYVCEKESNCNIKRVNRKIELYKKIKAEYVFNIIGHFTHYSISKRLYLSKLRGLSKSHLEKFAKQYYNERIRPHLIPTVMKTIAEHQAHGHRIIVVSASYDIFLKLFCEEYKIDHLVTNSFAYNNEDVFEGKIVGSDCIHKNKVTKFRDIVKNENYKVIASYGDSQSDIPILSIAEVGYVISHNKHKKWVDDTDFREVIWK